VPEMTQTETAERIKQKAFELFMQYGFRSVSMDDIAGNLGMSKKTIYQSFADKEELVTAIVDDTLLENQECCIDDKNKADNAVHEIFLAIDMFVEMFSQMNPSLLYDMQKYHPHAFARFQKHKNEFLYNVMKENIIRGIKEELYRHDLNLEFSARFRVETMMLPFNPEFQHKVKLDIIRMHEEMMMQYLFSLASPKGYKLIVKYQQERTQKTANDAKKLYQ